MPWQVLGALVAAESWQKALELFSDMKRLGSDRKNERLGVEGFRA